MHTRLRHARIAAGFKTATEAIDHFHWRNSTYRAHENGQNNFSAADAAVYAKAYGVSASWLLLGEEAGNKARPAKPIIHKHDCIEHIHAISLLLREDRKNTELIKKLDECIKSLKAKSGLD
jgi:hypothetical protein